MWILDFFKNNLFVVTTNYPGGIQTSSIYSYGDHGHQGDPDPAPSVGTWHRELTFDTCSICKESINETAPVACVADENGQVDHFSKMHPDTPAHRRMRPRVSCMLPPAMAGAARGVPLVQRGMGHGAGMFIMQCKLYTHGYFRSSACCCRARNSLPPTSTPVRAVSLSTVLPRVMYTHINAALDAAVCVVVFESSVVVVCCHPTVHRLIVVLIAREPAWHQILRRPAERNGVNIIRCFRTLRIGHPLGCRRLCKAYAW